MLATFVVRDVGTFCVWCWLLLADAYCCWRCALVVVVVIFVAVAIAGVVVAAIFVALLLLLLLLFLWLSWTGS